MAKSDFLYRQYSEAIVIFFLVNAALIFHMVRWKIKIYIKLILRSLNLKFYTSQTCKFFYRKHIENRYGIICKKKVENLVCKQDGVLFLETEFRLVIFINIWTTEQKNMWKCLRYKFCSIFKPSYIIDSLRYLFLVSR